MTRILIVEDEPLIAAFVSTVLSDAGYEITGIAADESSAVTQASRVVPDFVVMDIKLANNSDGVELARRLQCGRSIPILFTSAYLDHHTLKRAAATNPVGFLQNRPKLCCLLSQRWSKQPQKAESDSRGS